MLSDEEAALLAHLSDNGSDASLVYADWLRDKGRDDEADKIMEGVSRQKVKDFKDLTGKVLKEVKGAVKDSDEINFLTTEGDTYRLYHSQSCCETVIIEDVIGDVNDLIGCPILMAEEVTSHEHQEFHDGNEGESFTWTFYKFGTVRGQVTIRWLGTSNGYYSEEVSFVKLKNGRIPGRWDNDLDSLDSL